MPGDTSAARDVHINIVVPCGPDGGGEPDPSRCAPWGAPVSRDPGGRIAVVKELLERIVPLLDALQRAHRAGQLTKDDLDELSRLQGWYTCLQAESQRQPAPRSEE